MRHSLNIPKYKSIKVICFGVLMFCVFCLPPQSYAEYSHGPRQTGVVVLDELLIGPSRFVVSVGSGGCTGKNSFKVDVTKEEGLSEIAPHFVLTIKRTRIDECKALFDGGILILFDMEKDLGIKGNFTYSLTNPVYSFSSGVQLSDESLWSTIEKSLKLTD